MSGSDAGVTVAKKPLKRRSFLNRFLAVTGSGLMASVVYPILRYISPPRIPEHAASRVLAAKVDEFATRRWKIFPFGSEPAILVRLDTGEFRAFSAMCTHLSCIVQFEDTERLIWCACHNGWYDLTGKVIAGPPPKPLPAFKVNVVDGDIFVSRA